MHFIINLLILLPAQIASHFSWAGPLIMRLIVGYTFMLAGWGKLNNLAQVTENFVGWGIPFPKILTPFVSSVECFGGAMLILGLFTRPVAFILSGEMAFAYFIGHMFKAAPVFHPLLNGGTLAALYCFTCLYLSTAGAGPWSVDASMKKA